MKSIFCSLLFVVAGQAAHAGTEINYVKSPLVTAESFLKGDANNFRIESVVLAKEAAEYKVTTDLDCKANPPESAGAFDCESSETTQTRNVVQATVRFDSDSDKYDDGNNYVVLALLQDNFSPADLQAIKQSRFDGDKLLKLNVVPVDETVWGQDDAKTPSCPESETSCPVAYKPVIAHKLKVELTHK